MVNTLIMGTNPVDPTLQLISQKLHLRMAKLLLLQAKHLAIKSQVKPLPIHTVNARQATPLAVHLQARGIPVTA